MRLTHPGYRLCAFHVFLHFHSSLFFARGIFTEEHSEGFSCCNYARMIMVQQSTLISNIDIDYISNIDIDFSNIDT